MERNSTVVSDRIELQIQNPGLPARFDLFVHYTINGINSNEKDTVKVERSGGGVGTTNTNVNVIFSKTYKSWYRLSKIRKLIDK
jgi:hypothetical protein